MNIPRLAFQAAAALSPSHIARLAPPRCSSSLTLRNSRRYRPPPHSQRPPPPSCSASPPTSSSALLDETILLPSSLPHDRQHPVKVTLRAESLGGRRRRVRGGVHIPAPPPRVWEVLTAYPRLADYMPNIVSSVVEVVDGVTYLEQVGLLSRKLNLRSRMRVKVEQERGAGEVVLSRVEGRDFVEFVGRFHVGIGGAGVGGCQLDYELVCTPFPLFPMALVERKMFKEVPRMLAAVREEAVVARYVPVGED